MAQAYHYNPYAFVVEITDVTTPQNVNTAATAGVAIPEGYRFNSTVLAVTKSGQINAKIYGYHSQVGWAYLQTFSFNFPYNETNSALGLAGMDRVQAVCNGISAGAVNFYWGFAE